MWNFKGSMDFEKDSNLTCATKSKINRKGFFNVLRVMIVPCTCGQYINHFNLSILIAYSQKNPTLIKILAQLIDPQPTDNVSYL